MRDTIDLIREAGFKEHNGLIYVTTINDDCAKEIERLVALVRADEREAFAKIQFESLLQAIRIEREAMLDLALLHAAPWHFQEAIRARGNT